MARPSNTTEKRKELVLLATACFTRYGYGKTTLDDVAGETGINKASLYHYFKNKEELFVQVLLSVAEKGISELITRSEKIAPGEKMLVFYFSERLHLYLKVAKLNSLNKETLLHLQQMFDAVYEPVKQKEILYVTLHLKKLTPGLSRKKCTQYARLLFEVADAEKHNAVYTGGLLENESKYVNAVKKLIKESISLLLKGIKS